MSDFLPFGNEEFRPAKNLPVAAPAESSRFDERRQTDERGEFWSARDLMGLMDYGAWREFKVPLERAMATARNQKMDVTSHFGRSPEKSGGRPRENYRLTRYGAYLVAMNGDPKKAAVAAAQHYFAVRTREAETTPRRDLHAIPSNYIDALREAADMAERAIREQARADLAEETVDALETLRAVEAPKAEAYDRFIDADGTYSIGAVAKMIGWSQNKLFAELRNTSVLISKGHMRNTPYQRYMHHFQVKAYDYPRKDGTTGSSYTTRVQPSGVDFIRRRLNVPADPTAGPAGDGSAA